MAIEIYDNAKIVKKNDIYYYFLKYGSKNSFTCPNQTITDNNFNNKYIMRLTRDSNWHVAAYGNKNNVINDDIAKTDLNCPTSQMYGQIRFGNKKNIALYFVKNKNKILNYELLNDTQKANIDNNINYYLQEMKGKYTINLEKIEDKDAMKENLNYCEKTFKLNNNYIIYKRIKFWDLNNL